MGNPVNYTDPSGMAPDCPGLPIPITNIPGMDLKDKFRITREEVMAAGGMLNYLNSESEAMVLTRIAVGESPSNGTDRFLIMWQIKIRAELGYKNGISRGYSPPLDRWGPKTSIKIEGLAPATFQYDVVRSVKDTIDPELTWHETRHQRLMLSPTDDYLPAFEYTYNQALQIVNLPVDRYTVPSLIRGYDGHQGPQVASEGWTYADGGGLPSVIFGRKGTSKSGYDNMDGNIWQDRQFQDNIFFGLVDCTEEANRHGIKRPDEGHCPP